MLDLLNTAIQEFIGQDIFSQILVLLLLVWISTLILRYFGIPTLLGELAMGVILGPAVLGWFSPNEHIKLLADLGIFFIMLHAGIETKPVHIFSVFKKAIPIASGGVIFPFLATWGLLTYFGVEIVPTLFIATAMGVTAIDITIKVFRDLGLINTRLYHTALSATVIDDIISLILLSLSLTVATSGLLEFQTFIEIGVKLTFFFAITLVVGLYIFPYFRKFFATENKKTFTFLIVLAFMFGIFAEHMGLSFVFGAFFAGLFFSEENVPPKVFKKVEDRVFGTAFSFLGPIFFVSLGFEVSFSFFKYQHLVILLVLLVVIATAAKTIGSGLGALYKGIPGKAALLLGSGMNGRAEVSFVALSLALAGGYMGKEMFSLALTAIFLINILTPIIARIVWSKICQKDRKIAHI